MNKNDEVKMLLSAHDNHVIEYTVYNIRRKKGILLCPKCKENKATIIYERGEGLMFCYNCGWVIDT